jgi:putative membrane protein
MSRTRLHLFLLIMVIAVLVWSSINPSGYPIWVLEVGPSVISVIIIVLYYRKIRFTTLTYTIIALLSILTFIGGHFTYDDVPLFEWLKETYDLKRNHYDRLGHFFKGALFIVFREVLILKTSLNTGKWVQFLAVSITLSLAAIYEIVEWIVSILSNKTSQDFVGAQGDVWDAQWDMALTFLGSLLAMLFLTRWHNRQITRSHSPKK